MLPKENFENGINWVIYTVSVFVTPMKLAEEGTDPGELFRFPVAWHQVKRRWGGRVKV